MNIKGLFYKFAILMSPIIIAFSLLIIISTNPKIVGNLKLTTTIIVIGSLLAFGVLSFFIIGSLLNKFQNVIKQLKFLSDGDLYSGDDISNDTNQFLSEESLYVSKTFKGFMNMYNYLQSILDNDLDVEYKPMSKKDMLGLKLVELAENLKTNKQEIEKAKAEELQRNWISHGLAKFSEILRLDTHDMKMLANKLISNLVDYIEANQGAFYVLEEAASEGDKGNAFELVSAVAYNRTRLLNVKIKLGEGLVGRCAFEKKSIFLKEVPQNYVNISSGLGTANPSCILIVPCMLEGNVFGVLELASFNVIEKHQIDFIEKLGETIASTIANVQINEKTAFLLAASKKQGEELAAQEEELRQNLEEMEATQDDLERQIKVNNKIREEISNEKFLFDTLLDHIPARVFFKDTKGRFIKASKSLVKKFGKTSYSELAGLSDADLLDPEFAKKTMADEQQIMQTRQGRIKFVEYEKLKDGSEIWKTVSKVPLINSADQCVGTFGIINDITEFKLLEKNCERMHENYSHILTAIQNRFVCVTFNNNGNVIEVNELACETFNIKSNDLMGMHYNDMLSKHRADKVSISESWENLLKGETISLTGEYIINGVKFKLFEVYIGVKNLEEDRENIMYIANKCQ